MAIAHSVTLMQAAAPPKLNTTQQTFLALERAKGSTSITEDDIRRRYPSHEDLERAPPSLSNTEMGRSKPKLARSSMLFATSRGRRLQSRRRTCRDPNLAPKLL
jgi:hypothetical protein